MTKIISKTEEEPDRGLKESTNNIYINKHFLILLKELIIISKNIYDFLFRKMAVLFQVEENPNQKKLFSYLNLLYAILGETKNIIKPKNYFTC